MKIIKFKNWNCHLVYVYYSNGRTAIQLEDAETKELIAVATVNIVNYKNLKENEVIIKDYSENEGMFDSLYKAGIIGPVKKEIPTGFVYVKLCNLLINKEEYEQLQ